MDCSICFEEITKQTGSVNLSCDHSFHYRCVDRWFVTQVIGHKPLSCPCCRDEGGDMDRFSIPSEAEDSDTLSDASSEDIADILFSDDFVIEMNRSSGQYLFTPTEDVVFHQVRNMFGGLNELEYETPVPEPKVLPKLQALIRGYLTRRHLMTATLLVALKHS